MYCTNFQRYYTIVACLCRYDDKLALNSHRSGLLTLASLGTWPFGTARKRCIPIYHSWELQHQFLRWKFSLFLRARLCTRDRLQKIEVHSTAFFLICANHNDHRHMFCGYYFNSMYFYINFGNGQATSPLKKH